MLVLTRRAGESLLIGDDIELTVVEIQGDKIKIGIKAPKTVSIVRKELVTEAENINREAACALIGIDVLGNAVKKKAVT